MDHGIEAHLELELESVRSGDSLRYRIVNDGERAVGYGAAGVAIEREQGGDWIEVPLGDGWFLAWRREIEPGAAGPWTSLPLPATVTSGRHRLTKSVHPPFERQGVQPVVQLAAEFTVA